MSRSDPYRKTHRPFHGLRSRFGLQESIGALHEANMVISPKTTQIGENGVVIASARQQWVATESASSIPGIVERGD